MPPPKAASSKSKTIDGFIGNANANIDSRSAEPSSKGQMYEMCKEICKGMSDSVVGRLDERFDAFETKFQSVLSVQTELQNRMESQEHMIVSLEEHVGALEAKCEHLTKYADGLQTKVQDLEARSRRYNIKIVGIKEGSEEGRPTDFVSRLIPELLGQQHFPHAVKVDRAHRSLQPKPAPGSKPRTIVARVHHFQDKELIMRLARTQQMEYKGNRVLIFPDYTNEVMSQHRAFRDVMQALRGEGIKHHLRYPARLHVQWRNEDAPEIYTDPSAAEAARLRRERNDPEND